MQVKVLLAVILLPVWEMVICYFNVSISKQIIRIAVNLNFKNEKITFYYYYCFYLLIIIEKTKFLIMIKGLINNKKCNLF